jgi:hypothetical protein
VRRQLILRNVICPSDVGPSAFDVSGFAERLDLGAGENTLRLENISVNEWEKVRLQVLPDRLQLGFKQQAEGEVVRRVAEDFLARCDEVAPGKAVGFNAAAELVLEEGDSDPSEKLVNAQSLAEALGGHDGRGGVALVYHDDLSRWWLELTPQPEQDDKWTFDFNRHFKDSPAPGADRDSVLDWFADVGDSLIAQFETICGGTDR